MKKEKKLELYEKILEEANKINLTKCGNPRLPKLSQLELKSSEIEIVGSIADNEKLKNLFFYAKNLLEQLDNTEIAAKFGCLGIESQPNKGEDTKKEWQKRMEVVINKLELTKSILWRSIISRFNIPSEKSLIIIEDFQIITISHQDCDRRCEKCEKTITFIVNSSEENFFHFNPSKKETVH